MGSSPPPSRLTALQRDLLGAFFARERRFFLTGGGALAGFYLGHRATDDLDLFTPPGPDLTDAARTLTDAARELGASVTSQTTSPDFRRLLIERRDETCVVDLVVDRAPLVDATKAAFGAVVVDTPREIAANKICALLGRNEIKDLVDLAALVRSGVDLRQALLDARRKDNGAEPATLAWLLEQIAIGHEAAVPGGIRVDELVQFRDELIRALRAIAFDEARRS